jgi:hypothetical protein
MKCFAMFILNKVVNRKPERVLCFMHYLRNTLIVVREEIVLCIVQVGV